MVPSFLREPSWYRAATLAERVRAVQPFPPAVPNGRVPSDRARRRLQRWRSQPAFPTDDRFAQRLAADGLTEEGLLDLLDEPPERLRERLPEPPAWLNTLAQALGRPGTSVLSPSALPAGQETMQFLHLVEPLLAQGLDRLRAGVRALTQERTRLPFDPDTIGPLLFALLPAELMMRIGRTLVLELNVARVQGLLPGATPDARFQSFAQRLRQRDVALSILQEYAVLTRQVVLAIDQWVNFSLEFLNRLCADWETLRATFSPQADPGVLTQVEAGGDRHQDGRAVLIARFRSGLRLVYKPKPMAVDRHFQELLAWLNARGAAPPFHTFQVLDRGRYGWAEFVSPQTCTTPEEVRRFYERQGGYLALLYALQATDFHFENLIAAGEHPVLIDLESLLHPSPGTGDPSRSDLRAGQEMAYSVLRVGLLPQRLWAGADSEGVDMSGLGAPAGQLSPGPVPYLESQGTDEMHVASKPQPMPGGHNRPSLGGVDVSVLDYADALADGFARVYHLLLAHRDELLADDGPLARFADDEVRVILRPTRTYAMLLQDGFHPDVLRDALDREQLFDLLWGATPTAPHLVAALPSERAALWRGDVPLFTTRPSSRDLWDDAGQRLPDFFEEPSLAVVRRRLLEWGPRDLERQTWFIRASLTTLAFEAGHSNWHRYRPVEPRGPADSAQLLDAAAAIGTKLETLALCGAEHADATWIGLTAVNDKRWTLTPMGPDLYAGVPGVALFLAYLGAVRGESRFTGLARAALATLRRQTGQVQQALTSVGGFDGWGGVIYTLSHLGVLWQDAALLAEAEALVERLPPLIAKDEALDVLTGTAGCVGALLALYRCTHSAKALETACRGGGRLLECLPLDKPGKNGPRLAGFSHGAAGIAWALLELAALTGDDRFRRGALQAVAYERSLFAPAAGNWPDLRKFDEGAGAQNEGAPRFMTAWCHGAPGIGLGRLRSLAYLDDAEVRAEIDVALRTTLAQGFGGNHSLCHGDLGNLELVAEAGRVLPDSQWQQQTRRLGAMILESIQRDGPLCGVPLAVETPGLMTGLAGIGYGLLRLAAPERVPSVLTLEPPAGPGPVR